MYNQRIIFNNLKKSLCCTNDNQRSVVTIFQSCFLFFCINTTNLVNKFKLSSTTDRKSGIENTWLYCAENRHYTVLRCCPKPLKVHHKLHKLEKKSYWRNIKDSNSSVRPSSPFSRYYVNDFTAYINSKIVFIKECSEHNTKMQRT